MIETIQMETVHIELLAQEIVLQLKERRFGGIVDTVSIDFFPGTSAATRRSVVEAIQRIRS